MVVLVDADIVAYRASYSTEDMLPEDAEEKTDEVISYILSATTFDGSPAEYFLTGQSNFRYDVATTAPYKGNRKGTSRPKHLSHVRDYLVEAYGAVISVGEEADDLIAIRSTEVYPDSIIASVDKDFKQVPGWHYNIRSGIKFHVDEWEGSKFFYQQILMGDSADNIFGLKGIGPKKSEAMLKEAETEQDLYNICLGAYDGDAERVLENARLLWLRREVGQLWCPPEVS